MSDVHAESHKLTIMDLAGDIFNFHVIPFLDPSDIRSLFLTSKTLYIHLNEATVWKTLFNKSFDGSCVPFDVYYKWPQLYKIRKNCKLLTWGSNQFSRLGVTDIPISLTEKVTFSGVRFTSSRLIKPVVLDLKDFGGVLNLTAGGFSFNVLTSDNHLMFTGRNYHGMLGHVEPGPAESDFFSRGGGMFTSHDHGRCFKKVAVEDPSLLDEEIKFVDCGSGRSHFIALDQHSRVWTWDGVGQNEIGIKLKLVGKDGNEMTSEHNYIQKIRAGWRMSSCMIKNVGIVLWNRRERVSDRSSRYGPATAMVTVVEGTSDTHDIVDYLVLEDCIIYLTQDGTLYRVKWSGIDLSTALSVPKGEVLHSFQKYATRHSRDHMSTSKFVRISGSFNKFTAITNDDQVLLGDKNSLEPKIIKELQYRSIIAVAVGDHHFLALDKEGKMYSWGKELEANGCLGLGKLSTILEEGMGRLEGNAHQRTVIVEKPHLVPIDGVVLAIAAGGWQSAALVYKP